jgi:hypothetical protein
VSTSATPRSRSLNRFIVTFSFHNRDSRHGSPHKTRCGRSGVRDVEAGVLTQTGARRGSFFVP